MVKLVACCIIENDEDVFELSLKSYVDEVDKVIIIDGNHEKRWSEIELSKEHPNTEFKVIHKPYEHDYIGADGKQRNYYLKHLLKNHVGDWAIIIDADEVVPELNHAKQVMKKAKDELGEDENIFLSPRMIHFFWNLGNEDAQQEKHYCPARIFTVRKGLTYPEKEHTTPVFRDDTVVFKADFEGVIYYHFGYARELFRIKKKFHNHRKKSNIHKSDYLEQWYVAHLTGTYLTKKFAVNMIPPVIKEFFDVPILEDMIYFRRRMDVEVKHFVMVKEWKDYFKPRNVLDVGCGIGHYLYAWDSYDVIIGGFDKSSYAVKNSHKKIREKVWTQDVLKDGNAGQWDLVTVLDILEHLEKTELPFALKNIKGMGERFLFSIPYKNNPDVHMDETHKIFESKAWWKKQLVTAGFIVKNVPNHLRYDDQLLEATK